MKNQSEVENELSFVEGLFDDYITSEQSPFFRYQRNIDKAKALEFIEAGGVAMELGCEVGFMTSLISPNVNSLDVIEG